MVDNDNGFYFWNSKGERGNHITWLYNYEASVDCSFSKAVKFLEDFSKQHPIVEPKVAKPKKQQLEELVAPPFSKALEYHNLLLETPHALKWWKDRGINEEGIKRWLLGYKPNHWNWGSASSIPIIENNDLKTIRHRIWNPPPGKGKYVPEILNSGSWMFNSGVLKGSPEEIILVEGEIKLMVAYNFGYIGVALSGIGNLPIRYIPKFAKVKRVYVCPDPILNSREPISPYELGWMKNLIKVTEVRLLRLPDKIDDLLLSDKKAYRLVEAAKRSAKQVTEKDLEAVNLKKSQIREIRALLSKRNRYNTGIAKT